MPENPDLLKYNGLTLHHIYLAQVIGFILRFTHR